MTQDEVKNHLNEILKDNINSFTTGKTQRNLIDKNTTEKTRMSAYHGRELLELLQNIDDAYQGKKKDQFDTTTAYVHFDGSILSICNMGTSFEKDNIERLCQGGVSGKKKLNFIGNKGVGFRSVLNWASRIEIFSGDYSLAFSNEYAQKQFELIKSNEIVKKQISERNNLFFPILGAPEYLEPEKSPAYRNEENIVYDTIINITIDNEKLNDGLGIKEQIDAFDEKTILFLPNIGEIVFDYKGEKKIIQKKLSSTNPLIYSVTIYNNGKLEKDVSYYYFSNINNEPHITIEDEESLIKLAVAIPVDEKTINGEIDKEKNYFYTFFPIRKCYSPFRALLHATFDLDQSRDFLNAAQKTVNTKVFEELLIFYVNIVSNSFGDIKYKDLVLKLLTPIDFKNGYNFPSDLGTFGLIDKYYELCKSKKIFLTANSEFVSIKNQNIYHFYKEEIPSAFKGPLFKDLIVNSNLNDTMQFISYIVGNREYSENELLKKINELTNLSNDKLSVKEKIEIFFWWNSKSYNTLPNLLLKAGERKYLSTRTTCFLSGSIEGIPSWSKIQLMDNEYENELIECFKRKRKEEFGTGETDKRILPRLIRKNLIDIQEQSSKVSLISPINQSIGDDYYRAIEFLKWLWDILKTEKTISTALLGIEFRVPTNDMKVAKSENTYLGIEYQNQIGELFFSNSEKSKIIDYGQLALVDATLLEVKTFLILLGVQQFPSIRNITFRETEISDYLTFLLQKKIIPHPRSWEELQLQSIKNIKGLLSSLETTQILKWIFEYKDLHMILLSQSESKDSIIGYKLSGDYYETPSRKLNTSLAIPYLKYVFMDTKWISIGEEKYSPKECIINNDINIIKQVPETVNSKIREQWIKEINSDINEELICDDQQLLILFNSLGAANHIYDFDTTKFYSLLLKLQKDNSISSREVSRKIYRQCCIDYDPINDGPMNCLSEINNNSQRDTFFKEGKVWATNRKGEAEYHPVNDTMFSSSAVLNLNNHFLIDVPSRNGNKDRILQLFNVQHFEENYIIDEKSITYNDSITDCLKHNLNSFLIYMICYRFERLDKTEIELYKSLHIYFVSNIYVDSKPITELYTVVQGKSKKEWYIYVSNLSKDSINLRMIADCVEQIFNVLLDFPAKLFLDKIGSLFIASEEDKKHIYFKDFGTDSIFEQASKLFGESQTEEEQLLDLLKKDNIITDKVKELIDYIDFYRLNHTNTQEYIYDLLVELKKDVPYLRKLLRNSSISVINYNRKKLKDLFEDKKDDYFERVYALLENSTAEEQLTFMKKIADYDLTYNKCEIPDTVSFSPEQVLDDLYLKTGLDSITPTKSKSDIWKIFENTSAEIKNKKEQLKKIYNELSLKYSEKRCSKDFENFISKNNSPFYFHLVNIVYEQFREYLSVLKTENEKNEKQPIINPEDLERMKNAEIKSDTELLSGKDDSNSQPTEHFQNSGKGHDGTEEGKHKDENEDNGGLAEYAVVEKLRNYKIPEVLKYFNNKPYETIWLSKYAHKYEDSPFDDMVGYDIKLISKEEKKELYIEVKSSKGNVCEFKLSENESKVAKNKKEAYRIVFVGNIEAVPQIYYIDRNIFEANDEFNLIPIKYRIRKIH